uniref:MucR family transcriptional regulator n=1 Tax=Proteus mirabilis TaxID=584 RepID=UPI0013D87768
VPTKPPAVDPKKSVTEEHIICLEDGTKLKTLKRYLWRVHQLTPEQYRLKWNLPMDYPMVAPSYSKTRRELAKRMSLGRIPQTVAEEAPG